MNAELVSEQPVYNPFGGNVVSKPSVGALVDIEQHRAQVEAQAAMAMAKRFPRNPVEAMDRILNACTRPGLAEKATYVYARGGANVTGPTIRLAEALAQSWGNIQFGIRELDQRPGISTVEAYAWDMETNTRQVKTFQVTHKRFSKKGTTSLEDPRDIYEHIANNGARRLRACILGVIPGDVIESALQQCHATLTANVVVNDEAIKRMVDMFAPYGVTKDMIEKRIQRRLEGILPAQMVNLKEIYNSLQDGMSGPGDWFEMPQAPEKETKIDTIKERLKKEAPAPVTTEEDQQQIPLQ